MQDSTPGEAAFFSSEVAYHKALEWRFASGDFNTPGPAAAWTRPGCTLVEGEPISPLQHLLVMTDAASGISAVLDWSTATFANVDLSVALHRPPRGEWLGMDATTVLGDSVRRSAPPSCSTPRARSAAPRSRCSWSRGDRGEPDGRAGRARTTPREELRG